MPDDDDSPNPAATDETPASQDAAEDEDSDDAIWNDLADAESEAATAIANPDEPAKDKPARQEKTADTPPAKADDTQKPALTREELEAQVKRLQDARKSDKGRLAAKTREINRLRSSVAQGEKTQKAIREDTSLKTARAKVEDVKKDYGDVVGPVAETIDGLSRTLETLAGADAQRLTNDKEALKELHREQEQAFLAEHPDGFETVVKNRKVFDTWIQNQPLEDRQIFYANKDDFVDGAAAALLVSKFKQSLAGTQAGQAPAQTQGNTPPRRQQQLDGARNVRSRAPSSAPPPDPNSENEDEHWNFWEQEERRKAAKG